LFSSYSMYKNAEPVFTSVCVFTLHVCTVSLGIENMLQNMAPKSWTIILPVRKSRKLNFSWCWRKVYPEPDSFTGKPWLLDFGAIFCAMRICRVIIIYFECVSVYTKLLMWGHRYRIYIITQLLAAGISQVYVYTSKYKFEWNEMTTNTVYKKIEKKEAPSDQKIFWPILGYEEIIKMYKNFTISYWSLVQSRESLYNK